MNAITLRIGTAPAQPGAEHDAHHLLRAEKQEVAGHDLAAEELDGAQPEELDESRPIVQVFDERREEGARIDESGHQEDEAVGAGVEPDARGVAETFDDEGVDVGDELKADPDQEEKEAAADEVGISPGSTFRGTLPHALAQEYAASSAAPARSPMTRLQYPHPSQARATETAAMMTPPDLGGDETADRQFPFEKRRAPPPGRPAAPRWRKPWRTRGSSGVRMAEDGGQREEEDVIAAPDITVNARTVP